MSLKLRIKVIPGARTEALDLHGDMLRVKVTTAPEKGRANEAVAALLAQRLNLPASAVRVVAGFTNPLKTIEIDPSAVAAVAHLLASLRQ
ncbi:MAG: DUF167 domain-containing protein [Pseudomonadales bacterium]|jgi:uncharacterized protein YggU (UPF0235/DUF167 family)|nr:DUF167 domain-containing protein [Pseudomonadales bacterium]